MITFDRSVCGDFNKAIEKEWLETNGLGGYASSTIIGANTRGYHGLLVSAIKQSTHRMVTLSKIEETIIIEGRRYEISCNQYIGAIYPEGYKYLDSFRLDPFPTFKYVIEDAVIEKSIFMVHGRNTVFVVYQLVEGPKPVNIELRPLIACRDFHGRMHENYNLKIDAQHSNGSMSVYMNGIRLSLLLRDGDFKALPDWYRNFEYIVEAQRGQESHEDLYSPGYFVHEIGRGKEIALIASTEDPSVFDLESSRSHELNRKGKIMENSLLNLTPKNFQYCISCLLASADQFLVKRDDYPSIIAGYHWFGDWGRDSMISLPGLTLVTEQYEIAKDILKNLARYCDKGMIPNYFPESGGQPEYNSVDASLWFIYAVKKYFDSTEDLLFIESELSDVLRDIIQHYREGTRYNIHTDEDGLLYAGEEGVQLTWMDAKIGDLVVTSRCGKAVEINALWYNALRTMEDFSHRLGHSGSAQKYSDLAEKTKESFNEMFWNEKGGYLYDCIDGDYFDDSIRPNQIFAISLPYQVLLEKRASSVLKVVQNELLTPYGLRTLSPKDKRYKGQCIGDQYSRDMAYHQGTVWAWLLGPFIMAYVRVNGQNNQTRDFIKGLLGKLTHDHFNDAGLSTISEIFDGDPPHHPRGCIAQAWSVAEILQVMAECCTSFKD